MTDTTHGKPKPQAFTVEQTMTALRQILDYAAREFKKSQQGYFSHGGWAAQVLEQHLEALKNEPAEAAFTEADIEAAREFLANVHNKAQMASACRQLRPDVVVELAARGLVPAQYASPVAQQTQTADESPHERPCEYDAIFDRIRIAPGTAHERLDAFRDRVVKAERDPNNPFNEPVNAHPADNKDLVELLHRALRSWEDPPAKWVALHDRLTGVPAPATRSVGGA